MSAPTKTSLIDQVDQADHRVGVIPRGRALALGANFRTAHAFVFGRDGRLLLQRLAPARERHPSRWGSSVAGYLFAGEDYEHAVRRRLAEEIGVEAPVAFVAKMPMQDEQSTKFVALYRCVTEDVEIREPDHIAAVRWWRRAEVEDAIKRSPDLFTPTFVSLFRRFGQKAASEVST